MIKSMTGFGQGSAQGDNFKVRVDIRTVNNRFLDVHVRLPQEFASLELTIKKQVQASLSASAPPVAKRRWQHQPAGQDRS